jgi:hypothetical protein
MCFCGLQFENRRKLLRDLGAVLGKVDVKVWGMIDHPISLSLSTEG